MLCKNPGSLKRHINAKHASSVSLSVRVASTVVADASQSQQSKSLPSSSKEFPCNICGKVLKSQKNHENHVTKVHGSTDLVSDVVTTQVVATARFQCSICAKVLSSKRNLDNHLVKVHASTSSGSFSGSFYTMIIILYLKFSQY